jgi:hypothetical protein
MVRGRHPGWFLVCAALLIGLAVYVLPRVFDGSAVSRGYEGQARGSWVACSRNAHNGAPSTFVPLADQRAAARVVHQRETRPYNARPYTIGGVPYPAANYYRPSAAELKRFRSARISSGQSVLQFNPYLRYVDGRAGLGHPSTDDLIQWAAQKWGIPVDWLRAQYVTESYWNQFQLGDEAPVSARWYQLYPAQSRVPHSRDVYESLGITQVKWLPDGSVGAGTDPLRWKSTAFNIDFQAAMVRFYFDNPGGARTAWGDRSYAPCQPWNSIAGWYNPFPWGNEAQARYISKVRGYLYAREWTARGFLDWQPPSFPPRVHFR